MATVRLDVATESALSQLSARRGQTRSEVIRDAIARLADEGGESRSAYEKLQAFDGIVDSGGLQRSTETGRQFREILEKKLDARRSD